MARIKHPAAVWLLIGLLFFLALGGLFGGISMLLDPSGTAMGLPLDLLAGLPVSDFLLPGLFLIGVMGLLPLAIAWGLWTRQPWAWVAAVGMSLLLLAWIGLQVLLWGAPVGIQLFYLGFGVVLLVLCLLPSVRGDVGRRTAVT